VSGQGGFVGLALEAFGDAPREAMLLRIPDPGPHLLPSSPRITTLGWMRRELGWSPHRLALIAGFERRLAELRAGGVEPVCALVGGSIMGDKEEPGDLDGLIVYRLDREREFGAEAAEALRRKEPGLDLRFVPADAEPALLVKMSCFFHMLYQGINKGLQRPSVLLALDRDGPEAVDPQSPTRPSVRN
jgi:hypothetical protein